MNTKEHNLGLKVNTKKLAKSFTKGCHERAEDGPKSCKEWKSFSASKKSMTQYKMLQKLQSKFKTSVNDSSTATKAEHMLEDGAKIIGLHVMNDAKNSKQHSSKFISLDVSSSDSNKENVRRRSKRNRSCDTDEDMDVLKQILSEVKRHNAYRKLRKPKQWVACYNLQPRVVITRLCEKKNRSCVEALPSVSDSSDTDEDMDVLKQILSEVGRHNAGRKLRKPKQWVACYNLQPRVVIRPLCENTCKRLTNQDSNCASTAKRKECNEKLEMDSKEKNYTTVTSPCKTIAVIQAVSHKKPTIISSSYTMSDREEASVVVKQDHKAIVQCTKRKLQDKKCLPKPWTKMELSSLYKAVQSVKGDKPDYWEYVATNLKGRTAEACQKVYMKEIPDKRKKVKMAAKSKSDKTPVLLTAKVGTLKRKQQLRDFIDQQNIGYKDDLFLSTPFRMHTKKVTQNNLDDDTDSIFDELARKNPIPLSKFHTPNSRFYIAPVSEKKTPASTSLFSPWSTVNKKDVDHLIHQIHRKCRRFVKSNSKKTKVSHSEGLKAVLEEAPVKSLFGSSTHAQFDLNRLFASDQSLDPYDDEDEEKDYYWSDQMEEDDDSGSLL